MSRLIIVSNRVSAPKANSVDAAQGGLAVALASALSETGGIWFGWSGETVGQFTGEVHERRADGFTVSTIDLEEQDLDEYYNGYANRTLWPLFHYRIDLAEFDRHFGQGYERVNDRFAAALSGLTKPDDIVWVHDYHLIPLGQRLRREGLTNPMGFFLHIPWPPLRLLTALPHHRRLVDSMLEYDLIGFQTEEVRESFLHYLRSERGLTVDEAGLITFGERLVRTGVYPVGIDQEGFTGLKDHPDAIASHATLKDSVRGRACIIGVDRLDYSKGLIERFNGFRHFLEEHPQFRHKVDFLQIAPPSRGEVHTYAHIREELDQLSGRINGQFAHVDWTPIRYVNQGYPRAGLAGLYRAADVGLVTPLRDGMNLVAKEFVAAQDAEDPGVLVLSKFAGAAERMTAALLVNPYSRDDISDLLRQALSMPRDERIARWRTLFDGIKADNIHHWWRSFLDDLSPISDPPLEALTVELHH